MSTKLNKENKRKHKVNLWIVLLGIVLLAVAICVAVIKYKAVTEN